MGKIVHGNKNFGYAPINLVGTTYSFGSPVMLPGMVSSSMEVEQSNTSIYADDKTYCNVKGAKARSIEAVFRYITSAYAEYLGFHVNANGMVTDTGSFPNHCIFFESEEEDCDTGEHTTTLWYIYNVVGSEPSRETNTDEEEVTPQDITVNYSASDSQFVKDDQNEYCQVGYITRTEANKNVYDTFTTTVLLPTTLISA